MVLPINSGGFGLKGLFKTDMLSLPDIKIPEEIIIEVAKALISIGEESTKEKIKQALSQKKLEDKLTNLLKIHEEGKISKEVYHKLVAIAAEIYANS